MVDLPAPLGPTIATFAPLGTLKDTCFSWCSVRREEEEEEEVDVEGEEAEEEEGLYEKETLWKRTLLGPLRGDTLSKITASVRSTPLTLRLSDGARLRLSSVLLLRRMSRIVLMSTKACRSS